MKKKLLLLAMVVLPFLAGCATGYTRIEKIPEKKFGDFKVVEIPDLEGSDQIPSEVKKSIPDEVSKKLSLIKAFTKIERSVTGAGEPCLVLQGRVVQFNPGSKGMRWLTGPIWGVGKGSVIVNVKFIEKTTKKLLSESRFEGEIKGGFFGGDINETYEKIAEEISQFVKSNL